MPEGKSFDELQKALTSATVGTIRAASNLAAEDVPFLRATDERFKQRYAEQERRILSLLQKTLQGSDASKSIETLGGLDAEYEGMGIEMVDSNWRSISGRIDDILEQVDMALGEYSGAIQRNTTSTSEGNQQNPRGMPKPQLQFERRLPNVSDDPFKPLITAKPHAKVPLSEVMKSAKDGEHSYFPHPYQTEIEQYEYPADMLKSKQKAETLRPASMSESPPAVFVDTPEQLSEMIAELKQASEIAIDLEHHDKHSYIGIVSLMQISTRNKDWIVDTLVPWRHEFEALNEVFTDPSIIKVLHGAMMDIVWLQRDLGLYIVGLFDTHHACKVLGYSGGSLAFLLKKFVDFDAKKKYQMADWRVRPLPKVLFDYARSDTHFLLYIFDMICKDIDSFQVPVGVVDFEDPLAEINTRSKQTALRRFELPRAYDKESGRGPGGWSNVLLKSPASLDKRAFSIFKAVHGWRDAVARDEDENPFQILSTTLIFSLSRAPPMSEEVLLRTCQPLSSFVRSRAGELCGVISDAVRDSEDSDRAESSSEYFARVAAYTNDADTADFAAAAAAAQASAAAPLDVTTTTKDFRAPVSLLWGRAGARTPLSAMSPSEGRSHVVNDEEDEVKYPLPPLLPPFTARDVIFEDAQDAISKSGNYNDIKDEEATALDANAVTAEDQGEDEKMDVDTLIARATSGSKPVTKQSEPEPEPEPESERQNGDSDNNDNSLGDIVQRKAARKAERLARKEARRAARYQKAPSSQMAAVLSSEQPDQQKEHDQDSTSPKKRKAGHAFDYESGTSILHSSGSSTPRKSITSPGNKNKKQSGNKNNQEEPKVIDKMAATAKRGKSATFKS